jgi:hypothetical protein
MSGSRWDEFVFPKRGWRCDGVDSLPRPEACEMCGRDHQGVVHLMHHPDHPRLLRVDRVCAGRLEGDSRLADNRERVLQGLEPEHAWFEATSGNLVRNEGDLRALLYPMGPGKWTGMVADAGDGSRRFVRTFTSIEETKLALEGLMA